MWPKINESLNNLYYFCHSYSILKYLTLFQTTDILPASPLSFSRSVHLSLHLNWATHQPLCPEVRRSSSDATSERKPARECVWQPLRLHVGAFLVSGAEARFVVHKLKNFKCHCLMSSISLKPTHQSCKLVLFELGMCTGKKKGADKEIVLAVGRGFSLLISAFLFWKYCIMRRHAHHRTLQFSAAECEKPEEWR